MHPLRMLLLGPTAAVKPRNVSFGLPDNTKRPDCTLVVFSKAMQKQSLSSWVSEFTYRLEL